MRFVKGKLVTLEQDIFKIWAAHGWTDKTKLEKDKDFKGSIFEKLGMSEFLCPVCGANLKESMGELICLNACHLSAGSRERYQKLMGGKDENKKRDY